MSEKMRQLTLEEIQADVEKKVGEDWRVQVVNKENGHVQIRTTLKNA
jgi:hypothetical protein